MPPPIMKPPEMRDNALVRRAEKNSRAQACDKENDDDDADDVERNQRSLQKRTLRILRRRVRRK
jgi:hypothetical protein